MSNLTIILPCAGQYYIDENYGPSNNSILFEKKSYNRN